MNTLLIVLCIVAAVSARKGHGREGEDISKIAGCEDAESVKGFKPESCCASLPQIFTKELYKSCKTQSGKGDKCAAMDCIMKASKVCDDTGKFSSVKAKEMLKGAVNNDASWPIGKIVDDCVAQAPADLKAWQEKMASLNKTETACENPENYAIVKCLRRNLILSCPSWDTTTECGTLLAFAKACPKYPFREHSCGDHDHSKDDEKMTEVENTDREATLKVENAEKVVEKGDKVVKKDDKVVEKVDKVVEKGDKVVEKGDKVVKKVEKVV